MIDWDWDGAYLTGVNNALDTKQQIDITVDSPICLQ